jgi:hypothetical protein
MNADQMAATQPEESGQSTQDGSADTEQTTLPPDSPEIAADNHLDTPLGGAVSTPSRSLDEQRRHRTLKYLESSLDANDSLEFAVGVAHSQVLLVEQELQPIVAEMFKGWRESKDPQPEAIPLLNAFLKVQKQAQSFAQFSLQLRRENRKLAELAKQAASGVPSEKNAT